jgi:alpha-maltose-1-phosphate synthase
LRIVILTNEYPPNVYGGAGVHVEYLARELSRLESGAHHVHVLCFGDQDQREGNLTVRGIGEPPDVPAGDPRHGRFLETMARDLAMAGSVPLDADVLHGHTWYSHFAGCLARQLTGAPLALTTHSLEPHRPWKAEQLGSAYQASSWIERTAYGTADGVVAVSEAMRRDVMDLYGVPDERVQVIPNGIDPDEYHAGGGAASGEVLARHGIDPAAPFVLFVGRITRQKGIIHLVRAIPRLAPGTQVVLAAGAPDTDEIGREMEAAVERAREAASGPVVWIREMLPREDVIALYGAAAVFVCPSVYEPFGIINLEAMACETPVVASNVGGIPGIVVDGETGLLVDVGASGESVEPRDPEGFAARLADAVNALLADPGRRERMGRAGRRRVEERFSWTAVAEQTLAFYRRLRA